jgi:hypothetical protein
MGLSTDPKLRQPNHLRAGSLRHYRDRSGDLSPSFAKAPLLANFEDAEAEFGQFIARLNQLDPGHEYRLPTPRERQAWLRNGAAAPDRHGAPLEIVRVQEKNERMKDAFKYPDTTIYYASRPSPKSGSGSVERYRSNAGTEHAAIRLMRMTRGPAPASSRIPEAASGAAR